MKYIKAKHSIKINHIKYEQILHLSPYFQRGLDTRGLFKDKIQMSDDFNEPLPGSFWLEGEL